LPLTGDPQAFVMWLPFWYSPPSTFSNAGQSSVVQGIEFTTIKSLAIPLRIVGT